MFHSDGIIKPFKGHTSKAHLGSADKMPLVKC